MFGIPRGNASQGKVSHQFLFFPLPHLLLLILRNLDINFFNTVLSNISVLLLLNMLQTPSPIFPGRIYVSQFRKKHLFFLEIRNRSFNLLSRVQTHVTSGHQFRICTLLSAIYLLIIHYSMCDVTKALYASTVWPFHATK